MSPRERGRSARARGGELRRSQKVRLESENIYIVSEGEGTEYDYFSHINRAFKIDQGPWLKFPPRVKQKGLIPGKVLDQAATQVGEADIDEVWALFDHDARPDEQIDPVCADARQRGVEVALSHPAFELWLLLHFEKFSPVPQSGRNGQIIQKLRRAHTTFADYGDNDKHIDVPRFNALMENDGLRHAVTRARALDAACRYSTCPASDGGHTKECLASKRDPSTGVWRLIERLHILP